MHRNLPSALATRSAPPLNRHRAPVRGIAIVRAAVEAIESRLLLSASTNGAFKTELLDWNGQQREAAVGQWIVQLNGIHGTRGHQSSLARNLLAKSSLGHGYTLGRQLVSDGLFTVNTVDQVSPATVLADLKKLPGFQFAEPDFVFHLDNTTPNDPFFGSMWDMNNTGQSGGTAGVDIRAAQAWDLGTGDGSQVVGVVDTGIDMSHPDLAANIYTNPGEIPGNGIDDDGNGFVDDVHGWDFLTDDNNPTDMMGHGTHVAGTIGARGNNGVGVTGVNWNVKLMPLRIGGSSPSDNTVLLSAGVAAIDYVTMMRNRGVNIHVINCSWGGSTPTTDLYNSIQAAGNAGVLTVCAAGNNGSNMDSGLANYPAAFNLDSIISVANITRTGALDLSSNYGLNSVDLGAPGNSILSTWPVSQGSYATLTGTSMASPHVAGAAAFLFGLSPGSSAQDVRNAILNNTDATSSLAGRSVTGGRLDLYKAALAFANLPHLSASSDTGSSSSDGITNDTTPTFVGKASPNAVVQIFANGVAVGSDTANASGDYAVTSSALSDGTYAITATWTGQPDPTPPINITIDTIAAAPQLPDLDPTSDTGASSSDNITRLTTIKVSSTFEAGRVTFLLDGTAAGSGSSDGGSPVSANLSGLSDGVHVITATGTDVAGNISTVSAPLNVTVDTVANPPSTPALDAASDTGVPGDNITRLISPVFVGTAEPGTVRLYVDGNLAAVGNNAGNTYSVQPGGGITAGTHVVKANLTDLAGNVSTDSATVTITVDQTKPTVTAGSGFNYLTGPQSIVVHFSEDVGPSIQTADMFLLNVTTNDSTLGAGMSVSYSANTATWTFPGLPNQMLPDGNYVAILGADQVTDIAGNQLPDDREFDFFVLAGDANHDRVVDTLDFNALAGNFGGTGKNYSQGDFNYDGVVDTLDFNALAGNFGKSQPASSGVQSALAPAAAAPKNQTLFGDVAINPAESLPTDVIPSDGVPI